jgi:hypothetical protein
MKLIKHFLPLLILGLILSGIEVQAQSKKTEKEKQEQMKRMEEELKLKHLERQAEIERILQDAKVLEEEQLQELLEKQQSYREQAMDSYKKAMEERKGVMRLEERDWPIFTETLPEIYGSAYRGFYSESRESTSLSIQKDIEELTFETKFKYDIKGNDFPHEGSFRFNAQGTVKDGTILIELIRPDGDIVQEFEVSPLADVKWSQLISWDEENQDDNIGTWTITVSAKQATGSYSVTVKAK